ncbi:MAG: type II secretion system protein GspD [Planctomycetes bacterium]|nr:type II secretion system protein GspD [Planctomycetota bacterium]
MQIPPHAPQAPALRNLLGLGLLCLGACGSPNTTTPRARNEQINLELFQQLIEGGTMTPLEGFEDDEYLAELEKQYAELGAMEAEGNARNGAAANQDAVPPGPGAEEDGLGDGLGPLMPEDITEPPINPYLEFGSQIYVYGNGLVMKPYTFPPNMGRNVMNLLQSYGDFAIHGAGVDGEGMPDGSVEQPFDSVLLDLRQGWSIEAWSDPRGSGNGSLQAPSPIVLGDLLIVTASPDVLMDVEHFINIFVEDVKQIEIEAKIVEVITTEGFDFGIAKVDDDTPIFGLPNSGTLIHGIDFSLPNTVGSSVTGNSLLSVGAVFDGVTFNAVLEAVASNEHVSIISRPKVAVREGARAEIVNTTEIPFFNISNINSSGNFTTNLSYKPVGVQMYVIPRVVGDDTVVLSIDIEASQQTGTAVTFSQGNSDDSSTLGVPLISSRRARTIVRLEPGQAVILGGLITERSLERERKVPFLGDIPVLGYLFKSTYQQKEKTNVLFFIRPRILQGGDLNGSFDN